MDPVQRPQPELQDADPGRLEVGPWRPDDASLVGLERLRSPAPVRGLQEQGVKGSGRAHRAGEAPFPGESNGESSNFRGDVTDLGPGPSTAQRGRDQSASIRDESGAESPARKSFQPLH